ncbi:putative MFS-family transport protein [Klebsiella pneumoniae]|uniref:Putative MFS-family transport protein n=1 Tax=Klebsiella pneumoniae TaxID=573 RepID=A0A377TT86_KLEPN|nr:putative MFS-family transport protein [Klebsiella pneumoniae]
MSALGHHPGTWSGVLAMTLCVFVLIASEFMPVSLLNPSRVIYTLPRD